MKIMTNDGNTSKDIKILLCANASDRLFKELSNKLLNKTNCVLFYFDPNDVFNADFQFNIEQMNMIVVPITSDFIKEQNSLERQTFSFAVEKGIPRLLLACEPNIEKLFSKEIGDFQIYSKYIDASNEIDYEKKIKKYMDSVLADDDLIARIRDAFSIILFLSYRKIDRQQANEVIKEIHKYREDIGIWYDEFLTSGEEFNNEIRNAIEECGAFVMVITPNLIDNPNYITTEEYPLAQKLEKTIIPIQKRFVSQNDLAKVFDNIPNFVRNVKALLKVLDEPGRSYDDNPEILFLLGCAYLNGIFAEINRHKAVELLRKSSELKYADAIKKLIHLTDSKTEREELLKKLLNVYTVSNYTRGMADTLYSLAEMHIGIDHELSRKEYLKAINLYKKLKDYENLFYAYNDLSVLYKRNNNFFRALFCLKLAGSYLGASDKENQIVCTRFHLNFVNTCIKMLAKSGLLIKRTILAQMIIHNLEKAIVSCGKCNGDNLYVQFLTSIIYEDYGMLYKNLKMFSAAEDNYKKTIEIREKLNKETPVYLIEIAFAYHNLGNNYLNWGERAKSVELIEKALEYYREARDIYMKFPDDNTYKKHLSEVEKLIACAVQKYQRFKIGA